MTTDDVIAAIDLYDQRMAEATRNNDRAALDRIGKAWHSFAATYPLAYTLTGEHGEGL